MKRVSIILQYSNKLNYSDSELNQTIMSLLNQNYSNWEIIVVDSRKEGNFNSQILTNKKIIYSNGDFKNKAHALNNAIRKASGDYIMILDNEQAVQSTWRRVGFWPLLPQYCGKGFRHPPGKAAPVCCRIPGDPQQPG